MQPGLKNAAAVEGRRREAWGFAEAVVFVAGISTLGAEIAAARLIAPAFGASTVVWANTIAIVPLLNPAYVDVPANTQITRGNLAESSANGIGIYANDTISIGQVAFAKPTGVSASPAGGILGDAKYVLVGIGAIVFLFYSFHGVVSASRIIWPRVARSRSAWLWRR